LNGNDFENGMCPLGIGLGSGVSPNHLALGLASNT